MFWPLVAWTPHSSCLYPPAALVDLPHSCAAGSLVGSHMHKSRSQNLSSHPKSPTYHPPIIHPPIKLHRTIQPHTAARPQRFETTRGFDSNPGTSAGMFTLVSCIKPYGLNPMGFPCLDQGLQGVHPSHGSSWLPASSASLLWRLAWSGAAATEPCRFPSKEDPIQQQRGFLPADMSCLLNSVKPLSKICCTSIVQINI